MNGDMCTCGDLIASVDAIRCDACQREIDVLEDELRKQVRELTAQFERQIIEQEERL